jgi:2-amino-4-hydroxy-6-hydroxymethyldihydropteridine diphosphokinase
MKIGIALGSNLGDPLWEVSQAVEFLRGLDPQCRTSSRYSSLPLDCPAGSPEFINAVVEMSFRDGLMYLLGKLQAYELERGRAAVRETNSPRPIDLDILYADELEIQTSRLVLPHPRMMQRLFVLEPLAEICPDRVLPGQKLSVRVLLEELKLQAHDQVCRKLA